MTDLAAIAMILTLLPWWVSAPIAAVLAVAVIRWFFRRRIP